MNLYKIDTLGTEEVEEKSVHLYFQSRFYILTGGWQWNLQSSVVYCSDVMLNLPANYIGTKGIVHPDDTFRLAGQLNALESNVPLNLCFRIITTYGTVVALNGTAITATEGEPFIETTLFTNVWEQEAEQRQYEKENRKLQQALALWSMAEKWANIGTWHFNTTTYDTYFSDNLYRLYGLMPQALNPHLKTFETFLHPDDAVAFSSAFEKAYQSRIPLHVTYRIIDILNEVKYLQLITGWDFNEKGEHVVSGTVMDLTGQKKVEAEKEVATGVAAFLKEQMQYSEQTTGVGTWQINLFTRKSLFSDNCYRIYGLKPQMANLNMELLTNLAHPEDRPLVAETHRRILTEHECPETEYRIIRNDGKVRYVQLTGKPILHAKNELVMVGTIKDITTTRILESEVTKLKEELEAQRMVQQEVEAATVTCIWLTDTKTGEMNWSQNFYSLLGYKPNSVELTQQIFTGFVHQDDKKKFADTLQLTLHEKGEKEIYFRLIVEGGIKHIKAAFKTIQLQGKNLFAAIMQDVSHATQLQQQQHDLQQLNSILNNSITEKVFVTDFNNNIILINKACRGDLIATEQQALQQNLFDVFPQLHDAGFMDQLQLVFSGKTACLPASAILKRAGLNNYLLFPLTDNNNKVHKVLHVIQDNTTAYALQQKVAVNIRLIESIIELMPGRVIVMDRHMNYVHWNRKCEEHYQIKKEEVIGKNILDFSPGFYDDPGYHEFKKTLSGEVVSITTRLNANAEPQSEVLLVPVAGDDNSIAYILWMVFDPSGASLLVS